MAKATEEKENHYDYIEIYYEVLVEKKKENGEVKTVSTLHPIPGGGIATTIRHAEARIAKLLECGTLPPDTRFRLVHSIKSVVMVPSFRPHDEIPELTKGFSGMND